MFYILNYKNKNATSSDNFINYNIMIFISILEYTLVLIYLAFIWILLSLSGVTPDPGQDPDPGVDPGLALVIVLPGM